MKLCFCLYANVLCLAAQPSVTRSGMVSQIISTIDPDHLYAQDFPAINRLLTGKMPFPHPRKNVGSGAVRKSGSSRTTLLDLAPRLTTQELAGRFPDVIRLLDEDKKKDTLGALLFLIRSDPALTGERKETFERCMGSSVETLLAVDVLCLPFFLAGLFLYIVLTNDNTVPSEDLALVQSADFLKAHTTNIRFTEELPEAPVSQNTSSAPDPGPAHTVIYNTGSGMVIPQVNGDLHISTGCSFRPLTTHFYHLIVTDAPGNRGFIPLDRLHRYSKPYVRDMVPYSALPAMRNMPALLVVGETAQVVQLTDVHVQQNGIRFCYTPQYDIPISLLRLYPEMFGLQDGELETVHWSIKNICLPEALEVVDWKGRTA